MSTVERRPQVTPVGRSIPRRLGLLLFSAIFLTGGWQQLTEPVPRARHARRLGLPVPDELVRASGVIMLAGALALHISVLRRHAAAILALQLLPVTFIGHRFWELEPGPQRNAQRVHFVKNVSLVGAAIYIAASPVRSSG